MAQNVIGGILLTIVGLMLALYPHGVWQATERWKQMGAVEASAAFVMVLRIVGTVTAIVGVLVCFGMLK